MSLNPVEETSTNGDTEAEITNSLAAEIENQTDNEDVRAQALRALLLSRKRKHSSTLSGGEQEYYC